MSPVAVGLIGIFIVLLFLFLGFPIGFGMLLVGFFGFAYLASPMGALNNVGVIPYEQVISKYDYLVLPLFLLMGLLYSSLQAGRQPV